MRCYYVLVHGRLCWKSDARGEAVFEPKGFFCYRFVLSRSEKGAVTTAFSKVTRSIDSRFGWLREGKAQLCLEAEDVGIVAIHNLLRLVNPGHVFYDQD